MPAFYTNAMGEADSWYRQGNEMMMREKSEEAIVAYDRATELDPNHVSAWNNKGIALFRLKRYQDAINCYDKALALNPNQANEDRVSAAKVINESLAVFNSAEECYSKAESLSSQKP